MRRPWVQSLVSQDNKKKKAIICKIIGQVCQTILLEFVTKAFFVISVDPQMSREIFGFALKAICPQVGLILQFIYC